MVLFSGAFSVSVRYYRLMIYIIISPQHVTFHNCLPRRVHSDLSFIICNKDTLL